MAEPHSHAHHLDWRAGLLLLGALTLAAGAAAPALAATATITGFHWNNSRNRAVFTLDATPRYRVFTLNKPARVVVDFLDARPAANVAFRAASGSLVRDIRSAPRFDHKGERVVFDLHHAATPQVSIRNDTAGVALVVDLGATAGGATAQTTLVSHPRPKPAPAKPPPKPEPVMTAANSRPQRLRDVVIAIDAGHGGKDPGAIGPDGLEEKTVTLAIAKDVYHDLARVKGIKPILTRKGDYFVTLGGRRKIAREAHADLFVSIHADSSPYHYPKGSTVYVLSQHGASSVAARILAQRENAVDKIGGVNLDDEEPVVRSAIVKLAQRGSIAQALQLAQNVMSDVNAVVPLHSDKVERAPFAVLKSPDIPSILVETAFISNRKEEHQLASRSFQEHIAKAIAKGIEQHEKRFAPPGTLIAARRHAIYALQKG